MNNRSVSMTCARKILIVISRGVTQTLWQQQDLYLLKPSEDCFRFIPLAKPLRRCLTTCESHSGHAWLQRVAKLPCCPQHCLGFVAANCLRDQGSKREGRSAAECPHEIKVTGCIRHAQFHTPKIKCWYFTASLSLGLLCFLTTFYLYPAVQEEATFIAEFEGFIKITITV